MSVSSTHIFMPGFSATAHVVNHMFPVDSDFKCEKMSKVKVSQGRYTLESNGIKIVLFKGNCKKRDL